MCKAFSCLVTRQGKVYWQMGVDGHETLRDNYLTKDQDLKDDSPERPERKGFARVEVTPQNGNYLKPDKWKVTIDEPTMPVWWNQQFGKLAQKQQKVWYKQIQQSVNLKEARNPVHPFKIKPPKKITKQHIALLREWASVRDSVRASVYDSVGASVYDSVGASVWDSVWDSVRASVWDSVGASVRDSVGAYQGSFFKAIKDWKYVDKTKPPFNKIQGYPYASVVKLWKQGLIPSHDSTRKTWRLHGGKDGKVLWEGKLD